VKAEIAKKTKGKGLSVLSGKALFEYDAALFVDDEEAGEEQVDVKKLRSLMEEEEDRDGEGEEGLAVAVQESLYLEGEGEDDDLDDLEDEEEEEEEEAEGEGGARRGRGKKLGKKI